MKRFNKAVTQLYEAFNNGTLNAFDCQHCAVGNLCQVEFEWAMHTADLGSLKGTSFYNPPKHKDFSEEELFNIEKIFLEAFNGDTILSGRDKEAQFKGLMAVIEYLAKLDNIKVPQITVKQFETVLTQ